MFLQEDETASPLLQEDGTAKPLLMTTIFIGMGAVGRCILELLLISKFEFIPQSYLSKIIIIEPLPLNFPHLRHYNYRHIKKAITPRNLVKTLSILRKGDLCIDVSVGVDAISVIKVCDDVGCFYINTSLEGWDEKTPHILNTEPKELYHRSLHRRMTEAHRLYKGPGITKVIDCGMNPGLISSLAKQAICDASGKRLRTKRDFAEEAKRLGLKVIHVSEIDTQLTVRTRPKNSFYNTWSCTGFYAEGVDPVQIGCGSAENTSEGIRRDNMYILPKRGIDVKLHSHTISRSGRVVKVNGFAIPHGESNTLSKYLSLPGYRPSVYYVYQPSKVAIESIAAVKANDYRMLPHYNVLKLFQLKSGYDSVGALLYFSDGSAHYCGTILDVKDAKKMGFRYSGPTVIQVAASMCSAINWMLRHPNKGLVNPEKIPHYEMIEMCRPFLGKFYSGKIEVPKRRGFRLQDFS